MKSAAVIHHIASSSSKWKYVPPPARFGRYPVLEPWMSMTRYPDIRPVPETIPRPPYVPTNFFSDGWGDHLPGSDLKFDGNFGVEGEEGVRRAGKVVAELLKEVGRILRPGITTDEVDAFVHDAIVAKGGYPSPLGYSSFPRSCTTSVNNVIAHGIPDDRPLHPEDIINVDLTLFLDGYHGDTSATFVLPETDKAGRELVEVTQEALEVGIRACGPGRHIKDIGREIQEFAEKYKFSVNDQFTGHGIGRNFHQPPWISHTRNTEPGVMMPGDCFTVEPSLVQGSDSRGDTWDDGWTMTTLSGARSAQFEHQVLITEDGVEVLTR